ncbi:MAG: pyruvate kinase [Thermoproteales archaeon]|nr:pyruvate kinase [Thermoproteales archaeon]
MRKTKIIATLGPASWSQQVISRLAKEGVNGFRINLSHAKTSEMEKAIEYIRSIEEKRCIYIPIIGDLQGPVVRLGEIEDFEVAKGDKVFLVNREEGSAEAREIPLPESKVFYEIAEGDILLIEGGRIRLRADSISDSSIECMVLTDGIVRKRKTFAIQGKDLPLPTITEKDMRDVEWCIEHDIDYIGLSFVRNSGDIEVLKDILRKKDAENIKIITKIETKKAVENLKNIIKISDAVLVARGDLAIYYGLEEIPELQDRIIKTSRSYGKPVILATQIMESMTENPMPTRSEVLDVMHAVREGVDALLLAGETAIGKYPVESVSWLRKIIIKAEEKKPEEVVFENEQIYDKFARGVVILSDLLKSKIVAFSRKGSTARRISRYRPQSDVYVFTPNIKVVRQLNILWGLKPYLYKGLDRGIPLDEIVEELKSTGELSYGDLAIATAGLRTGTTDIIRIIRI